MVSLEIQLVKVNGELYIWLVMNEDAGNDEPNCWSILSKVGENEELCGCSIISEEVGREGVQCGTKEVLH